MIKLHKSGRVWAEFGTSADLLKAPLPDFKMKIVTTISFTVLF